MNAIVEQAHLSYAKQGSARRDLWSVTLKKAAKDPDFLNTYAPDLVSLVFATAPIYFDAKSQRMVEGFIQEAVANSDVFLKTFAAGLITFDASNRSKQECLVLLGWNNLLVQQLRLPAAAKAATRLIGSQAPFLDSLNDSSTPWKRVYNAVASTLQSQPSLFQDYVSVATSTGSPGAVRVVHTFLLRRNKWRPFDNEFENLREPLLASFSEHVIGAKTMQRSATFLAYQPVLRSVNFDDFSNMSQALLRMVKRNPDIALTVLAGLCQNTSLDLSKYAIPMVEALAPLCRSPKDSVRNAAVEVLTALSRKVASVTVVAALAEMFLDIAEGSAGAKLKVASERASTVAVAAALVQTKKPCDGSTEAADPVLQRLAAIYKADASEEVKLAAAAAIGVWLPLHIRIHQPSVTHFEAALKDKEVLRRANLRALAQALQSGAKPAFATPLQPVLISVVKECALKAATRSDAVTALYCLSIMGCTPHDDKVWEIAFSGANPLLKAPSLGRLPEVEASLVALLIQAYLEEQYSYNEYTAPACEALVLAGLHHSAKSRRRALKSIRFLVKFNQWLVDPLTVAIRTWQQKPYAGPAYIEAGDDSGISMAVVGERFAAVLLAAVSETGESIDAATVTRLALAACHPVTAVSTRPRRHLWTAVMRALPIIPDIIRGTRAATSFRNIRRERRQQMNPTHKYTRSYGSYSGNWGEEEPEEDEPEEDEPTAVVSAIVADVGWVCPNLSERQAVLTAVQYLMAAAPEALLPPLTDLLRSELNPAAHDQLSALDLAKWQAPEGSLAAEVAQPTGFQAQAVDSKNVRKARGRHKMDYGSDSDDDATTSAPIGNGTAHRASHTKAAVKGAAGKKDPAAERRARLLMQEAEVRGTVDAIKRRLDRGLMLLAAIARGDKASTREHLAGLAAFVMPLLGSQVVGEGCAWEAVAAMAASLPLPLCAAASDFATGLRLLQLQHATGAPGDKDFALSPPVKRCISALTSATADKKPLPASTWAFVFPLIQTLLMGKVHTKLHESAVALVALHVASDSQLPRRETLQLLCHLLSVAPAYRDRVQPLLTELCRGCTGDDLPAALEGLLADGAHVRGAMLEALTAVPAIESGSCPQEALITTTLWMAKFDASPANAEKAENLWEESGAQLPKDFALVLMPLLGHRYLDIRGAAADALAAAVEEHPDATDSALTAVIESYAEVGASARGGAAQALRAVAPLLQSSQVAPALEFLLSAGLADPDPDIRELMVAAGVTLVDSHGSSQSEPLMELFERYLDNNKNSGGNEQNSDHVREGVVVLLGTLARHMTSQGDKVRDIVETLLEVLVTPSQAVQRAVSSCLPPLMTGLSAEPAYVSALIQRLLAMLQSPRYADRRGGAYGLAGVVKGLGIAALRAHGIMASLKATIEDKKSADAREGSLFAFQALVDKLGRLFEPYVIQILPMLLACFGDGDSGVREAADSTSRAIMSHLSGHGVKLVLPALLTGLDDKQWRTKQGSIQMLGAMAYCAPKQLSTALPTIVPRLSAVLSDPHPKVQAAARTALNEVGSVIRNPEVSVLVPVLLGAIADTAKQTRPTLEVLLDTVFINTIDAASLALIVPVVARGLRDRSGDAKRKAARIVGNMCALTNEPKDMVPYVSLLMPELQAAVVDPLPEVRSTAAQALGSLLRGMGEDQFTELVPWLLATLRSEGSGVERSGAAQGLAEVLAVLGTEYLTGLLPDILASCAAPCHFEREGNLLLFKFLPLAMEDEVQEHLETILPAVLGGLADEAEGVRSASLAAGRTIVDLYSLSALELLLPAILDGTAHANWRIRQSSIELLGDLLFKVAGTTGKVRLDGNDDDEGASTEEQGAAILAAFGYARRNEVLARIYMARSDVGYSVRTAAVHVWKTVVTNTPRTTTEILPVLMSQLIESLSCEDEERQQMAAGCLGELVRKMGERVLQKIIPILQDGISNAQAATRQGVCAGIQEVLQNVTRQQLADMLPTMLPTIQTALCDSNDDVRTAAGGAFGILFRGGAGGAVDSVIPSLLIGLSGPQPGQALAGLRVILGVRPSALNTMLPKLLKPPLTKADVVALGSLSEVAGTAVHNHLSAVVPPLLELCSTPSDVEDDRREAASEALGRIIATVTEDGAYLLVAEMVKALEEPTKRRGAADAVALFCTTAKYEILDHLPSLLSALLPLFIETDEATLLAVWTATGAATTAVPKEAGPSFVRTLKEGLATATERQRRKRLEGPLLLPGLGLPKALTPLLPIYLQGVLQGGSAEVRELAAEGLGELVRVTNEDTLKPFVIQITGPLIRIIGDRFASSVKAAILGTLAVLLHKAGPALKPFLPQLQTTFLKCLSDASRPVRHQAGENLGQLAALSPRVDQLAGDQLASSLHSAEGPLREGYAAALRGLLRTAGSRLSPLVVSRLGASLATMLPNAGDDESLIAELAGCLGEWSAHAAPDELAATLAAGPLANVQLASWSERLGNILMLDSCIQCALPRLQELQLVQQAEAAVVRYARDGSAPVKLAAAAAVADLVTRQLSSDSSSSNSSLEALVAPLVGLLGLDQPSEVQRGGMQALRRIAAVDASALHPHLVELLPLVAAAASAVAGPTRVAAERTFAATLQLPLGVDHAHEWLASARPGATVRSYLTEPTLRRLARLQLQDDDGHLL